MDFDADNSNNGDGVLDTARRFGSTLLATVRNRFELLALELQEEGLRAVNAILMLAAVIAAGFMALLLLTAGIIILLWNSLGVGAVFLMCGIAVIGAAVGFAVLRSRIKKWQPFPGTVGEMKKDREWLTEKN